MVRTRVSTTGSRRVTATTTGRRTSRATGSSRTTATLWTGEVHFMPKDDLAPMDVHLPKELRQRTLDDEARLLTCFTDGTADKPKTYKKVCTYETVRYPDNKFHAIRASLTIKGTVQECIQNFFEYASNIDESSPDQVLDLQVFQRFFFWDQADRDVYEDIKRGGPLRPFSFYSHTCTRSPAPAIVKHRDMVVIGRLGVSDDSKQVTLTMQSVSYEDMQTNKAVRGKLDNNTFRFTQQDENTVLAETYCLADPLGAIPSWVYNTVLQQRCDVLVLLRQMIQGEAKPKYSHRK